MQRSQQPTVDGSNSSIQHHIHTYVSPFLSTASLASLARTNKRARNTHRDTLLKAKLAKELLRFVINGDHEGTLNLLRFLNMRFPGHNFATHKASGIEHNGRHWENVSPIEFAAWAGDLTETGGPQGGILNLLCAFAPDTPKDKQLITDQLTAVRDHGLKGSAMLAPYAEFVSHYDDIAHYGEISNSRAVIADLGKRQRMLPIVGLQYICGGILFPNPNFQFAAPRQCRLEDGSNLALGADSPLGKTNLLRRGDSPLGKLGLLSCRADRDAIAALITAKQQALNRMIARLASASTPQVEPSTLPLKRQKDRKHTNH